MHVFGSFLQMMNSMGGDDLPDLDGADDEVCFLIYVWKKFNQVKFNRYNSI